MRRFALILVLWPGVLAADGFVRLNDDEILEALSGRTLSYPDGATQSFDPSMSTQYFSGRPSAGRWTVRQDQYCSLWPPSDLWACYDVERDGDVIRFVGSGGDVTDGVYAD